MIIRPAIANDATAICNISNPLIEQTAITFTTELKAPGTVAKDIVARDGAFFVAEENLTVVGFATYFSFRPGPGYAATKEHSINLAPCARGRGIGHALMKTLEDHAYTHHVHSFCAAISGENSGGIAFHQRIGFNKVAHLPQVGRKFERWIDLIVMQKFLN